MRNATIATSRTRAHRTPIAYRPLPAAYGDVAALQEVRATRRRAAEQGLDPSTVITVPGRAAAPAAQATATATRTHASRTRRTAHRGGFFSGLFQPA